MGAIASKKTQPHDCLLNRLFRRKSKKTSKLRVTGLCVGNSQQNIRPTLPAEFGDDYSQRYYQPDDYETQNDNDDDERAPRNCNRKSRLINSLAPGRCDSNLKIMISKPIEQNISFITYYWVIVLMGMSQNVIK